MPACLGFGWKIEICGFQCFALHLCIRAGVNLSRFNLHISKKISNVMKINVRTEQVHCFGMADMEILPFYTPGQGGWHRIYVGQVVEAYQK